MTESHPLELHDIINMTKNSVTNRDLNIAASHLVDYIRSHSPKNVLEYNNKYKDTVTDKFINFTNSNAEVIDQHILEHPVGQLSWISVNTFYNMYLTKYDNDVMMESIEQCWIRIACHLYSDDGIDAVLECYNEMIAEYYTPPSPIIFNASKRRSSSISCYLIDIPDTFDGIVEALLVMCQLSANGGGIGLSVAALRNSAIGGEGISKGPSAWAKMYDSTIEHISQGGKRKGAITIFNNWYSFDIQRFVESSVVSNGDHTKTLYSAKTAVWVSWLLLRRIQDDADITLFCAKYTTGIDSLYGYNFDRAYTALESDDSIPSKYKKVIKARALYQQIIRCRTSSGTPFVLNFDCASFKSNHRYNGRILSNLCVEMFMRIHKFMMMVNGKMKEKTSVAVCNLTSINLASIVIGKINSTNTYLNVIDFELLSKTTRKVVRNINKAIDATDRDPLEGLVLNSIIKNPVLTINDMYRSIAVGVMGFADMLYLLDISFESEETRLINKVVFACIYWNCVYESMLMAMEDGPYPTFAESPLAQGKFDFDLWNDEAEAIVNNKYIMGEDGTNDLGINVEKIVPIDPSEWGTTEFCVGDKTFPATWSKLRYLVIKHGTRNSLFTAEMPTASSSQSRNCFESVEAPQSNLFSRTTLKGTYVVLNKHLENDLREICVWGDYVVEFLKNSNGEIAGLTNAVLKHHNLTGDEFARVKYIEFKYKTAWEIKQRLMIKLMEERSCYISHGASFSSFFKEPSIVKESAFIMESFCARQKTIGYYTRTGGSGRSKTIDNVESSSIVKKERKIVCTDEVCISCSS